MIKSVDIDGLAVSYSETGPDDSPRILLMHGWGCDHTTLASIQKVLETGMHVYSMDLPGFGSTPEPAGTWGVEEYTRLTEKFIAAVGGDIHILLGHSFGGRVGLLLSSRDTTITKLILVDAAGVKPRRPLRYYLKVYSYKAARHFYRLLLGRAGAEKRLEKIRARRGSADYAQASPRMRAILSRCVNEDLKHVMPSIKASTLLIWGADDTATPLSDAKVMEKLIPDAGLVSFDGCGHYSFLDNPAGFRAVLTEFLKNELTARRGS